MIERPSAPPSAPDPETEAPPPCTLEAILALGPTAFADEGHDPLALAERLTVALRREHRFLERLAFRLQHRSEFLSAEAKGATTPETRAEFVGQARGLN